MVMEDSWSLPSEPAQAAVASGHPQRLPVARSRVRDTWRWLWPATVFGLVPLGAAACVYARFWGGGAAGVGLTAGSLPRDLLLGTIIGAPLAALAIGFRRAVAPGYRLPTPADQLLQTAFYLGLNAPIEELFWRGMLQTLAISGATSLVGAGAGAICGGWAVTKGVF